MNILRRCYSEKYQKIKPCYIGCTVSDEWLYFSNFKEWMSNQDWRLKAIDKDILIQHNRVYSASTCIFISTSINNLLTHKKSRKGKYPLGVSLHKASGKYVSQCSNDGHIEYLGVYETAGQAHEAYKAFKYSVIAEVASKQCEPLKTALLNYVIEG